MKNRIVCGRIPEATALVLLQLVRTVSKLFGCHRYSLYYVFTYVDEVNRIDLVLVLTKSIC